MKILIQRCSKASVRIDGNTEGSIGKGLVVFVGIEEGDEQKDADWLAQKTVNLRIFGDEQNKMNLSLKDVEGEILIISQFTLAGDCRKGRRPDFGDAADPDTAEELYNYFIDETKGMTSNVESGKFGMMMDVDLVNQGPVTFMIESPY